MMTMRLLKCCTWDDRMLHLILFFQQHFNHLIVIMLSIAVKNDDYEMVKMLLEEKNQMEHSIIPSAIHLAIENNTKENANRILTELINYYPASVDIPHLKIVSRAMLYYAA